MLGVPGALWRERGFTVEPPETLRHRPTLREINGPRAGVIVMYAQAKTIVPSWRGEESTGAAVPIENRRKIAVWAIKQLAETLPPNRAV